MLKKRIIFKLYFKDNYFCLSRNFKLQKVGTIDWLFNNLNFSNIANFIDELVIINVNEKNYKNPIINEFKFAIQKLMKKTFIPLTIGGGLRNLSQVNDCFAIGADKILLNTAIRKDKKFVKDCIKKYGSQAVLCGIDFKLEKDNFYTYTENGKEKFFSLKKHILLAKNMKIGELFLTSIDRDGTGFGYEKKILKYLNVNFPVVLGGGAGKSQHFEELIFEKKISGLMTGNLFNFVGPGLEELRLKILEQGVNLRKI